MTTTPKLGIPLISSQQAQPEVTHNVMVLALQAILGGALAIANNPAGTPGDGDCYIVGPAPTGAYTGHANAIAIFFGGWIFVPGLDDDGLPIAMSAEQDGLSLWLLSAGERYVWNHTDGWIPESAASGGAGATHLSDLLDVDVHESGGIDGDVLTWDEAAGKWIAAAPANSSAASGGGGASDLADLGDVDLTAPADGQVLTYDHASGKWVNDNVPSSSGGGGGLDPGTPPTIVQFAIADGSSIDQVTMGVAPTMGNLLVAFCVDAGSFSAGPGWTFQIGDPNGTDYGFWCTKVAGSGESTTQQPQGSASSSAIMIWELHSASGTPTFLTAIVGDEKSGLVASSPGLPNIKDCLGLGGVGLVSGSNNIIDGDLLNMHQDGIENTSSSRQGLGCHSDLSDSPLLQFLAFFDGTGSPGSKCGVALIKKG